MASKRNNILIVGLGNIDRPDTRHSVGMKLIDRLSVCLDTSWTCSKETKSYMARKKLSFNSQHSDGLPVTSEIVLLKSVLPMNANGRSVKKAVDLFKISTSDVFLIHDELDKPVGKFGIKDKGSARGHNGVKSVITCLSSDAILRLRIGIDRPDNRNNVANYVLSKFTETEQGAVALLMDSALTLLLTVVEARMNLEPHFLVKHLESAAVKPLPCQGEIGKKTSSQRQAHEEM